MIFLDFILVLRMLLEDSLKWFGEVMVEIGLFYL